MTFFPRRRGNLGQRGTINVGGVCGGGSSSKNKKELKKVPSTERFCYSQLLQERDYFNCLEGVGMLSRSKPLKKRSSAEFTEEKKLGLPALFSIKRKIQVGRLILSKGGKD